MLVDIKQQESNYKPGPYWKKKTAIAIKEIKKHGIDNFRGFSSSAGTSFADNILIDQRNINDNSKRSALSKVYRDIWPLNEIFNKQVQLTKDYFNLAIFYQAELLKNSSRINFLLENYEIPLENTKGECKTYGNFGGSDVSFHYLQILDTLDRLNSKLKLNKKNSFFEIGGGFGVNLHLLLTNFPNFRKVVYLDIIPNLYIGTQYLKSFYGDCVKDYKVSRDLKSISFTNDDSLEIYCIAPHQIELLEMQIDYFHNAHSFVEMPVEIIKNYVKWVERVMNPIESYISLVTYDNADDSTLVPDLITASFTRNFAKSIEPTLESGRFNFTYISIK